MCLQRITPKKEYKFRSSGIAYVWLNENFDGKGYIPIYIKNDPNGKELIFKKNKWYKSNSDGIQTCSAGDNDGTYEPAFHLIKNKKQALQYRISNYGETYFLCQVKYRKKVAEGIQQKNTNIIVARERMIIKEVARREGYTILC